MNQESARHLCYWRGIAGIAAWFVWRSARVVLPKNFWQGQPATGGSFYIQAGVVPLRILRGDDPIRIARTGADAQIDTSRERLRILSISFGLKSYLIY